MRAAVLRELGSAPAVEDFDDPHGEDGIAVEVLAAGLNPVDVSTASGRFYGGAPAVPYVVGREAVVRMPDGRRAYIDRAVPPFGTIAERTLVDPDDPIPLPEGLDDGLALGFGIAGLAAWLALEWRAQLEPGETVLVLGASGAVGQVAVQAAKLLEAGRVVAAARSEEGLEHARSLGADAVVQLDERDRGALAAAFREAAGGEIDVVVDPLWGEPALAAIAALAPFGRHVQLGQSAAAEAPLPSAAVRGRPATILGLSNFAAPADVRRLAYARMADLAAAGELTLPVERVPLGELPSAWERQQRSPHRKLVIVP